MNQSVASFFASALLCLSSQTLFAADTGQPAPVCSLSEIGGDAPVYDTSQFRGKVVYIDFWASWCAPCAKSFPFLNQMHSALKDKGLQVIGVNLDENPEDAKAFLTNYPVDFFVTKDTGEQCARKFDVKAMPSSYLVDRNGIVRHVHFGFRPGEAEDVRKRVEQLLAETPKGQ
jgi:thiol-disulfide isomerase/thioredoxin